MKDRQLSSKTLSEQAYEAIKGFIIKNELVPGQNISVNSLAKTLGISQTPVREAVLRLISDGFLIGEARKRLRITEITKDDVQQIYEVRRFIEPHAAALASIGISTDSRLKGVLENLFQQGQEIMRTPIDRIQIDDYLKIDFGLDEVFLQAAFPFFREVLKFVRDRSLRVRTFVETANQTLRREIFYGVTEEHLAIIQAILGGHAEESRARVLQHLEKGETRTLKAIRSILDRQEAVQETLLGGYR